MRGRITPGLRFAAADPAALPGADAPDIETYIGPDVLVRLHRVLDTRVEVIGRFTQQLPCNWKLYMENVRDTYHASLLHTFFTTFRITRLSQGGGVMVSDDGVAHASTTLAAAKGPDDSYAGMRADNQGFQLQDPSFMNAVHEFNGQVMHVSRKDPYGWYVGVEFVEPIADEVLDSIL